MKSYAPILLALLLAVPFVYANQFGSSTITQTTNSTTYTEFTTRTFKVNSNSTQTQICDPRDCYIITFTSAQVSSPPESRTISDYSQLAIVLVIVLMSALGIIALYRRRKK